MNNIDLLNALSAHFDRPWLLFVLIPAVALMLFPYFRLPKQHRKTRNRVISLALHSVILVALVLLLAGLSFSYTQVNVKKDVILLADVSDSADGSEDEMNQFIQSVLSDIGPEYTVGVVTFADGCVYSADVNAGSFNLTGEKDGAPAGRATDIASALLYSKELLSSPADGRIILLSDGRQTDGNALAAVKALADEGVRVDTVYFPSEGYAKEVQVSAVDVRTTDSVTAEILVTVDSTAAQPAVLTVYDNGEQAAQQSVNLGGGQDVFLVEQRISAARLHEICVNIEAAEDTLAQNNTYYTYLNLEVSTKTLLVDGGGRGAESLCGVLDPDFDVTKIAVDELPSTVEELCAYNEIIFMNVANADLPEGFGALLAEYVKVYGGGLFTVGGDKAYVQSDMNGTLYEELLPVEANTDAKSLGLLLIIDSSGSMQEQASGSNSTRMELAIDAAVASVECLSADDYVGVVSFNAQAETVVEMSPLDRKETIIRRIKSIETATGTYYYNALDVARNMLQTFSATELKHVIFLTDGEPVDADKANFMNLIDRMARNDITVSTIALGPSVSTDTAKEMAERGGGRFYSVVKESDLKRIMVEETTTAAGHYYNELTFTPTIVSHTTAVAGIADLPRLGGYYGAKLKDGATMVLGYEGSPIYAEWSCGEGRVGSFMSDLYGDWSAEYFTDERGVRFLLNVAGGLLSANLNGNDGGAEVEFIHDNFTVQAVVTARTAEGEDVVAELESPDGKTVYLKLERQSGSVFVGSFRTEQPGVYALRVSVTGGGGERETLAYTAFSYSAEYLAFADDDECFRFMESLSRSGNGSMLFSAENLFGKENESVESVFDPAPVLLALCCALFLLDIVARKFKIKLPSEIREERKNKLSGGAKDD